jgi:hypothetical protein
MIIIIRKLALFCGWKWRLRSKFPSRLICIIHRARKWLAFGIYTMCLTFRRSNPALEALLAKVFSPSELAALFLN